MDNNFSLDLRMLFRILSLDALPHSFTCSDEATWSFLIHPMRRATQKEIIALTSSH